MITSRARVPSRRDRVPPMRDLTDPLTTLVVAATILLNTATMGALLSLFRPGEYGYFARQGRPVGWATCLGVSCYLNALALIPAPLLVSLAMWLVIALYLFGLTTRQALKFSVAQGVVYWLLAFGIAVVGQ